MPRLIYCLDPALLNLRRLERLIYILDHALLNLQHLVRLIYSLDHALLNLQRLERLIYSLGHASQEAGLPKSTQELWVSVKLNSWVFQH